MESLSSIESSPIFPTIELVDRQDDRSPIEIQKSLDQSCLWSENYCSQSNTPKQPIRSTPNSSAQRSIYHTAYQLKNLTPEITVTTDFTTPKRSNCDIDKTPTTTQSNRLSSVYKTCIDLPLNLLKQRSRSIRQTFRRSSLSSLFDRIAKTQRLTIVSGESISIESGIHSNCSCRHDFTDGNCVKNFMEMSVQPAEYRNNTQQIMTSTPIISKQVDYDQSIFNVSRVKKVELHDLKPKVPELHVLDNTPTKDLCINNNNVHTPNGNYYNQQQQQALQQQTNVGKLIENVTPIGPLRAKGQLISNAMTNKQTHEDGNVLKKVISFIQQQTTNNTICKISHPNFVPEKLRFSEYNQFEGQMLIKWISSSITKTRNLNENDLSAIEALISIVCTHLIEAGVLKQIVDNGAEPQDEFCPYQMYQWTHIDVHHHHHHHNHHDNQKPKKLSSQNVENIVGNDDDNRSKTSIQAMKTRLLACDTVTSIYTEMKGAMKEIESHTNELLKLNESESLNGYDCIDAKNKLQLNNNTGFCKNYSTKCQNCDNQLKRITIDRDTQTESMCGIKEEKLVSIPPPPPPPLPNFLNGFESTCEIEKQNIVSVSPPPPPPPLPNFLIDSTHQNIPSIVTETPSNTQQISNLNNKTGENDKENIPNGGNIPIAPPLPAPVLSQSASSFCPPPPPLPSNGPPPIPIPSDKNMWFRSETLRKAAKHPKKPMINLFWTRIIAPKPEENEEQIDETEEKKKRKKSRELWQDIDETIIENVDEFGELFSRQSTPRKIKEYVKIPRRTCIKVLDSKRSQSVGIFAQNLHRLRIDSAAIENAIYNWDTKNVTLDLLQQMRDHRATETELKLINDAISTRFDAPLDGPEKFLLNFSKISCVSERIDCILFRTEFEEATGHIERKVNTVRKLCEFLIENTHLKDLFSIILTLGNFMNGGNRLRGQADGFGLDVLNKLKDVKSKDKKITLLHYIVKTFIGKRRQQGLKLKEIIYPVPSALEVKEACAIDFIDINDQISQLKERLTDFERKMEFVINSSSTSIVQPFKDISETFVNKAKCSIEEQTDQLIACKQLFRETLEFFHHTPKTGTIDDCTPSQFFELWSSFAVDFHELWKREFAAINAELLKEKQRIVTVPKASPHLDRSTKIKQKPTGLRVRRINQI